MRYAAYPKRGFSSIEHALFQAAMWREYAMNWKYKQHWLETVLQVTRQECIELAREALEAAKEMNRRNHGHPDKR